MIFCLLINYEVYFYNNIRININIKRNVIPMFIYTHFFLIDKNKFWYSTKDMDV